MQDYRTPTRKKVIQRLDIRHLRRGDRLFPNDKYLETVGKKHANEVWMVFTTTRTGLMPPRATCDYIFEEKTVKDLERKYPVGTEIEDTVKNSHERRELVQALIDSDFPFGIAAGDRESPLAFEVLAAAGLYEKDFGPISSEIVENLGSDRIKVLQERFPENWQTAAIYEYCFVNLPHSSAAFMAASYQYHYYITQDDFSAGYFWRDLEVIVHGVEVEAAKSIDTRARAGGAGGRTSSTARQGRRADLLDKMEAFVALNPGSARFGAEQLARVALDDCIRCNQKLWKQGKGQVNDYLGEIRRGEAGPDLQKRYQAIFGSKPPKGF